MRWLVVLFVIATWYASFLNQALSQVVGVGTTPTTTVVSSSANPSFGGESVTFTATVTGAGGTPTGEVTFFNSCAFTCGIGFTKVGTATVSGGQASFTVPLTTYGGNQSTYTIKAIYGGDATFQVSESADFVQTVNKASTTVTVTSSANPEVIGQPITFTATVTANEGVPTFLTNFSNDLIFRDGTTVIGQTNINSSGVATLTTSALSVGTHSITATFAGAIEHVGSTSAVFNQTVNLGLGATPTTTVVSSSANPSLVASP